MKRRVLTGMRTTGKLHLGHYVGALERWVEVQNTGRYECFFLLADVQALTTHAKNPSILTKSIKEVVLDWLAVGLNPKLPYVHFVLQSQVLERYALSQILTMIAKHSEVMRNPTLKSEMENKEDVSLGFIAYPVDQVADILMVSPTPPKKDDVVLVPVGEDQVPHLEYTNVLARRFNQMYGKVFAPCAPLVGRVGRLVGTDGQAKMSKSRGNVICLSDGPRTVEKKVMVMYTDPKRIRADVPGDTVNNPVFIYHRAFNRNREEVADLTERYKKGKVGDVEVKKKLAKAINALLGPIRERRAKYKKANIREILTEGTRAARRVCLPILEAVMEKTHLAFPSKKHGRF